MDGGPLQVGVDGAPGSREETEAPRVKDWAEAPWIRRPLGLRSGQAPWIKEWVEAPCIKEWAEAPWIKEW